MHGIQEKDIALIVLYDIIQKQITEDTFDTGSERIVKKRGNLYGT